MSRLHRALTSPMLVAAVVAIAPPANTAASQRYVVDQRKLSFVVTSSVERPHGRQVLALEAGTSGSQRSYDDPDLDPASTTTQFAGYRSAPRAGSLADDVLDLPTSQTCGRPNTLTDHFQRHGADFGAKTADDYAAQASEFFQGGMKQGLPTKVDPKTGIIRVYDPAANTFGAYNPTGTTRTFYKPDPAAHGYATNWDYWQAQPGYAP